MIARLYVSLMLLLTMAASAVQFAPVASAACNNTLLGIPAWYRNLQDDKCNIKLPQTSEKKPDLQKTIMTIALNVIQAALALVAYITIFFIIKGGFGYMTSAGSPDGMSNAKKTITNALIGMVIAVFAASILNPIGGSIK